MLLVLSLLSSMAAKAADPVRLVAFGDSLTAGYGLNAGEDFASQLQRHLQGKGINVEIINAGVSGDTTQGGLERLEWSVPEGTQGVILELGANDALRGLPPQQSKANLALIIEALHKRGIKVLLAGMLAPPNMGEAYVQAFNGIYPALAAEKAVPLYPFFLEGVAGNAKLNLKDGMHPTAEGISVIVGRIAPSVEALIQSLNSSPK